MDSERQNIIKELNQSETENWINEISKSPSKSSEESQRLRKLGNDLYISLVTSPTNLQMEEVCKLYSQSIAQAKPDSEDLAFAFGNRSALLLRMKKYQECISDIDRALKISQSDTYKIKFLCRKLTCLLHLDSSESKIVESEIETLISKFDNEDKNKKSLTDTFTKAKLPSKQSKISNPKENSVSSKSVEIVSQKLKENFFDSVSVKQDEKYGRYLVANRDFNAGEIIFVELPYVKVINLKNSYLYCSHCFVSSLALIPCDHCTWCMFCSEKCKAEAWTEYHDIECVVVSQMFATTAGQKLLDNYKSIHLKDYFRLSIKSLIIGLKQAGSIDLLMEELKRVDKLKEDDSTKVFETDFVGAKFKHLYILNDDIVKERLKPYTSSSIIILFSLIKCTSLFEDNLKSMCYKDITKNKKVMFIGSLLLKLHKVSDKNIQNIPGEDARECRHSNDPYTCHTTHCCTRGSCIIIIDSLINHSCNPNVKNLVTKKQKIILFSLVPIKKNSQIFSAYQQPFYETPKWKRQMILKSGFNFDCDCLACGENWPTINDIMENPIQHGKMNPKDIQFMNIEDSIVRSIMMDYNNAKCNQKTIETLSKALTKVIKNVNQPSISLWKLISCIQDAYTKVYGNC